MFRKSIKFLIINKFYKEYSSILIFILFCILNLCISILSSEYIITKEVYHNSLGEKLSYERIEQIVARRSDYAWLGYVLSPLVFVIKFLLVALVLSIGDFLSGLKIGFRKLFTAVLMAEYIYIIPALIHLFYFLFFKQAQTFDDVSAFHPWSLLALFGKGELEAWLTYPVYLVNVFEVLYWLALAYCVKSVSAISFGKSIKMVSVTYGIGLALWVMFVVFLSLSISK